tara:strand:- start:139 stop:363 length:225 start_codon:yes stop_codon:yes gene_type:complete
MNKIRIPVTITRTLFSDVFVELDDVQFDKFIEGDFPEHYKFNAESLKDLFHNQMNEEDFVGEEYFFDTDSAEEH